MFKVLVKECEPKRGSKYSACVDLFASEDVVIGAGETKLVGLGVCINIDWNTVLHDYPSMSNEFLKTQQNKFLKSHYLQLMLRSSLGKKGLILPNGVGVIDLDYKDEIKMIIHNPIELIDDIAKIAGTNDTMKIGKKINQHPEEMYYEIKKGDKIAQIILIEHKSYLFGIDSEVERNGGFGSTNKKDSENV